VVHREFSPVQWVPSSCQVFDGEKRQQMCRANCVEASGRAVSQLDTPAELQSSDARSQPWIGSEDSDSHQVGATDQIDPEWRQSGSLCRDARSEEHNRRSQFPEPS
jgi:hypothetical protein